MRERERKREVSGHIDFQLWFIFRGIRRIGERYYFELTCRIATLDPVYSLCGCLMIRKFKPRPCVIGPGEIILFNRET